MPTKNNNNSNRQLDSSQTAFAQHRVISKDGRHKEYLFLTANQLFKKIVDLDKKELTGKKLVEIIATNKLSFNWGELYDRVLANSEQLEFTTFIKQENSWYEVSIYKLADEQLLTTFSNISQKKINYSQVEIKKALEQKILNSLNNHIAVINQAGIIEYTNQAWKDFARENNAEPKQVSEGSNYLATSTKEISSSDQEIFIKLTELINGERDNLSAEYACHSSNQKRWFKMYANRVKILGQVKVVIVHEEITEQKLFEINLEKKFLEQKLLLDNLEIQVWYLKDKNTYGLVNRAHAEFLGREKNKLYNKRLDSFFTTSNPIYDNQKVFSQKKEIEFKAWVKNSYGKKRLLKITKNPKLDFNGEIKYVVCLAEDITTRERSRQKIRRQAKLRKLINKISTLFINLSLGEVDQAINYALKQMGEFIAADRCYIFLFNLDNTIADRSYLWHEKGTNPLAGELEDINTKNYPWVMEQLSNFNKIRISKLEQLPKQADKLKQLLQKANVKSILAVPIIYNNKLLGLIGFDSVEQKRDWSQEAISLLKISGELFAAVIKRKETEQRLADYTAEVEETNMELEYISTKLQDRINKAQKLHRQFLPSKLPQLGDLELAAYYQPAENLGGDFYNVIQYQNKLLFYIVDITGHGLDGAMLNIFIRESINSFLLAKQEKENNLSPKAIIEFIYQRYCQEDFPDDYFICTILGVVDLDSLEVRLTNAGIQVPTLITEKSGSITQFDSDAPPISNVIGAEFFAEENLTEQEFSLSAGDSLLLATDGLIEEELNQKIYGNDRLKEIFSENYFLPAEIKLEAIKQDFVEFAGGLETEDDITLFSIGKKATLKDSFIKEIKSDLELGYELLDKLSEFIKPYYEDVMLIQTGLQEMLINAIEHGNQLDEKKVVEVKAEVMEKYLRITIKDEGSGFNWYPKISEEFKIEKEVDNLNHRGRGIKIAKKVFDSIYYNQQGNQVYLVKLI